MTVSNAIAAAIETYLTTAILPKERVAFENMKFKPENGEWWARLKVFPGVNRSRTTISANAVLLEAGFADIAIFYPEDKGSADATAKADELLAALEGGTIVSSTAGDIHFDTPNRTGAIQENRWYQVNITAPYRFYRNT